MNQKRLPTPGSALDPDIAAHHGDELLGDGEPEPGAAVLAGERAVRLREGARRAWIALASWMPMPVSLTSKRSCTLPVGERLGIDANDHLAAAR